MYANDHSFAPGRDATNASASSRLSWRLDRENIQLALQHFEDDQERAMNGRRCTGYRGRGITASAIPLHHYHQRQCRAAAQASCAERPVGVEE